MMWNWKALLPAFALLTGLGLSARDASAGLDPQLKYLQAFRDGRLPLNAPFAPRAAKQARAQVYLVFHAEPSAAALRRLEARGVVFTRLPDGGGLAHVGRVFPASVAWEGLEGLARDAALESVEAVARRRYSAMDLSMPEIDWGEERGWPQVGADGLSGRGQLIANFDTSLDYYHPAFFKPDGGIYAWLDLDTDGRFSPGIDAVDLNGDGLPQDGETLRLLENALFDAAYGPLLDGYLDADEDWLYADTDDDGARDYGSGAGFGEKDPAFGEPLFIVDDADLDNDLSPGERLVRLGTSKVLAGVDGGSSPVYHTRGASLLTLANDTFPHGTTVSAILAGDVPGRRFVGVAPEAELLAIDVEGSGVDPVTGMSWAKSQGTDVMIYSFGQWSGEYLDGSSALEQAVVNLSAGSIPQVCPAGNIGQNNKHGRVTVPANGMARGIFFVDGSFNLSTVHLTALWRQNLPNLSFSIEFVSADEVNTNPPVVALDGKTVSNTQGDYVTTVTGTSSKGTHMQDMTLYHQQGNSSVPMYQGLYTVTVTNSGTGNAVLHLFLADDQSTWIGGATWTSASQSTLGAIADPTYSVTSPATSGGCIVVGSYATRQVSLINQLSEFSSRGPRIDEVSLLDLAAPGNYDILGPVSSRATYFDASISSFPFYPHAGSWQFSGTSASAPHVAGVAALLKQLDGSLNHAAVEKALRDGALADTYTGTVPNESWGMGKARAEGSIKKADKVAPSFTVFVDKHPILPNYLLVTMVPSEKLAAPPTLSSTTTTVGPVVSVEDELYTSVFPVPKSGSSVALSVSGKDLTGNTGLTSAAYSF